MRKHPTRDQADAATPPARARSDEDELHRARRERLVDTVGRKVARWRDQSLHVHDPED